MRKVFAVGIGVAVMVLLAGGCSSPTPSAHSTSTTTRPAPTTTVPSSRTTVPAATSTSAPNGPLPTLTIASWTGREAAGISFSGDAGDIATGLTWSTWGQTEAVGHGTRNELGCVPNCAQGTATPNPVTLTLTDPVDGSFTSILEQTADGRGTSQTFTSPDLAEGVCPTNDETSCVFVGPSGQ
jgi:hypothetical protein